MNSSRILTSGVNAQRKLDQNEIDLIEEGGSSFEHEMLAELGVNLKKTSSFNLLGLCDLIDRTQRYCN